MSILEWTKEAKTIAITGHQRPDGDCIGACSALYHYLKKNCSECIIHVFLDDVPDCFSYIALDTEGQERFDEYDVYFVLDCGDALRMNNEAKKVMKKAKTIVNIDHHISNTNFGQINDVRAKASSTCEVLFENMEVDKISYGTAVALYTGIIHDTGVFKHSNTSHRTMDIAGILMDMGVPYSKIIDESFYMKSYRQLQIMGRCLLESIRILDEKVIFAVVTKRMMDFYGAESSDLDGVIDQLRTTQGVEVAILLKENSEKSFKVSMRSNEIVDVSSICQFFGGGGHVRAAGCKIEGFSHDVINNLTEHIEKQLQGKV